MDERLKNQIDLVKDFPHLEKYFEDTKEFEKAYDNIISDTGKMLMFKKLIEFAAKIKNDFAISSDNLQKEFNQINYELSKEREQRTEILEQLSRQRILTSDLTDQLVNIKKVLETTNLSKEQLDELLVKTKDYLIECNGCGVRVHGTMDSIMNTPACKKCGDSETWMIRTRILA